MVGLLVGAAVFGGVADHFGRKLSFFTSVGFMVSTLVLSCPLLYLKLKKYHSVFISKFIIIDIFNGHECSYTNSGSLSQ